MFLANVFRVVVLVYDILFFFIVFDFSIIHPFAEILFTVLVI